MCDGHAPRHSVAMGDAVVQRDGAIEVTHRLSLLATGEPQMSQHVKTMIKSCLVSIKITPPIK